MTRRRYPGPAWRPACAVLAARVHAASLATVPAVPPAWLATGNTLIWGTGQVVPCLEGNPPDRRARHGQLSVLTPRWPV